MTKVKAYGCSSILTALCLQFQLAGCGLRCSLHRSKKGQWVVEARLRDYTRSAARTVTADVLPKVPPKAPPQAPVSLCGCRQGRDPFTCRGIHV